MSIDWEIQAYGETEKQVMRAIAHYKDDPVLMLSYATGILSDAQHVLEFDLEDEGVETARQYMNKAKLIMSKAISLIPWGAQVQEPDPGVPFETLKYGEWFHSDRFTAMKMPPLSIDTNHTKRTGNRFPWNAVSDKGELLRFDSSDRVTLFQDDDS